MEWDELESIMWQYYQQLPEPKISYVEWWYGDSGVRETLLTYHVKAEVKPNQSWEREGPGPIWARRGGK